MLADAEDTPPVTEELVRVFHKLGKGSASQIVWICTRVFWSVAEQIGLGRMAVEVEIVLKSCSIMLFQTADELVQCLHFRIHSPVWIQELPVQVLPAVARPKVSQNNSVRVHHRHDSEFMSLKQLGVAIFGEKSPYQSDNRM